MLQACVQGSRCGEPDCPVCTMTRKQRATHTMLLSLLDNLQVAKDGEWLVFEGEGQDGPSVGYILPNGRVCWITAG